jgi:hypothetical protein
MKSDKRMDRTKQRVLSALQHPIARTTDPRPSHLAAKALNISGRHCRQLVETLVLLCLHPRKTSLELSRCGTLDRYQIARRLPELEEAGLIVRMAPRRCTVGDRLATVWKPLAEASAAAIGRPKRTRRQRKAPR